MPSTDNQLCPCGSGLVYAQCCEPLHQEHHAAATAEALMRARYSAYALGIWEYVFNTWHPDTRPLRIDGKGNPRWVGLTINHQGGGTVGDDEGTVEFTARCRTAHGIEQLTERSRFVRLNGQWVYLDGEMATSPTAQTPGRNAPCPCGSGKKFKRCCGR